MAKMAVAVRLDPEVVEWADGYAKERGVSRQAVLEGAVLDFREDCERGVPDLAAVPDGQGVTASSSVTVPAKLPPPSVVPPPVRTKDEIEAERARLGKASRPPRSEQSRMAMERMRRMDPNRYGGGL